MNRPRLIRRVTARRLVGSFVAPFAALFLVGVLLGTVPAAGQDRTGDAGPEPAELVPDITAIAVGATIEDPAALAEDLLALDGVLRAVVDPTASPDPLIHVAIARSGPGSRPLDAVVGQVVSVLEEGDTAATSVVIGGSAIADRHLADRFARSAGWLAWLAVAIGAGLGAVEGWRRGLLAAAGLGLAVLAAAAIGAQVAAPFQGTMAGTGLPAALVGLVIAVATTVRLLIWFRDPAGTDGAAQIQRAVADLGPELVLLIAGLTATSLIVDPLDPGRSAVTGATIGAMVASVVVLAVLAPGLVVLGRGNDGPLAGRLPLSFPDGRHLSLPVVGLAALALAILAVAAFGRVDRDLLDGTDLDDDEVAAVAAAQASQGGDPTAGIAVTAPGVALVDLSGWAAAAAERADVAWIDVGGQRFTSTGGSELEDWASLVPTTSDAALVVPAVNPRGVEGQIFVDGLEAIPLAGDGLRLEGRGGDVGAVAGSRGTVLITVVALAVMAGLAVIILTGNRALGVVSAGLRLLSGGATVGLHNLVASDPSMASIQTTLVVIGIGSMASELELLRRLESEAETAWSKPVAGRWSPVPGSLAANPGQFGAFGLVAVILAGPVLLITSVFGGGPGTTRLAIALVLAALVDLGVGAVLLRPALLGQRAAFQTAARPLRVAAHARSTGDPADDTPPDDDPAWREVVIDLIQTEFWLQTEPDGAELGLVFEADTPVHDQANERHGNLARTGLRVVGRPPELRTLRTNRDRQPTILTVTVDHPASQLLDAEGRVVGVRGPERRIGRLWLSSQPGGGHRIAESIELGVTVLPDGAPSTEPPDPTEDGRT